MAFTHYLHAARLAREPELAALAARAALALSDPRPVSGRSICGGSWTRNR
jgi:hypothetical protein